MWAMDGCGQYLVLGCARGRVEVWGAISGKLEVSDRLDARNTRTELVLVASNSDVIDCNLSRVGQILGGMRSDTLSWA